MELRDCVRDEDGNIICSDYVLFSEKKEDIIDGCYIKDVWYCDPDKVYEDILKECKHIHRELFKGNYK